MSTTLAFSLVLLGTVAWISLPLLPAIRELMDPHDAGPLDAVGQDSGDLTFFADSFRRFIETGGHAHAQANSALPDGRKVALIAASSSPQQIDKSVGLVLAGAETSALADGTQCPVEIYGQSDLTIGKQCSVRAAFANGDLSVSPQSTIVRWIHGERSLSIGDNSHLLGRATSRGIVRLGRSVLFDRVSAPVIHVGPGMPSTHTQGTEKAIYKLPHASAVLAVNHWLVDGDLSIPDSHSFSGSLVVRGKLRIGANCEIVGSVKSHKDMEIGAGSTVTGTAAGRADIMLDRSSRVLGPVIAEGTVTLTEGANVGSSSSPASISADQIILYDGVSVYGSLSARKSGATAV